jgi:hypothetical protein
MKKIIFCKCEKCKNGIPFLNEKKYLEFKKNGYDVWFHKNFFMMSEKVFEKVSAR